MMEHDEAIDIDPAGGLQEEEAADMEESPSPSPPRMQTIHCPLIGLSPFSSAAATSRSLTAFEAGCLVVSSVQHLLEQMQLIGG